MAVVQGTVETGYEAVRDLLEQQFANGEHIGAGVSVYHRGRKVVDIWGGLANDDTKAPWLTDTMAICYSTTKGLTATCLHVLADRGLVDYQAPVAKYWPEFAQNGKANITVYHILTHQAGLAPLPDGLHAGPELFDWDRVIHGLEQEAPAWEPGTASGYHALTFGFLVGEIVRRVGGKSVGTFLRDELATPLGIADEMFIGAPESVEPRIAKLKAAPGPTEEGRKMMQAFTATPDGKMITRAMGFDLGAPPNDNPDVIDTPAGHRSEVPAISGIMTARALARFYAALAGYGELDGVRVLSEKTVRAMSALQTQRPDKVIMVPVAWSLGYMNGQEGWPQGPRNTSFGHIGLGGSVGYADPEIGMSFGLVVNKMAMDLIGAGRTAALAAAARSSCEANG